MKYFDTDWARVFASLPVWAALPRSARAAVLKHMKPSQGASAQDLGAAADDVLRSGLVDASTTARRLAPRPEHRPLVLLFRALDRQRIWDIRTAGVLADYVREHLDSNEAWSLVEGGSRHPGWTNWAGVASLLSSEEWMEDYLDADTPAEVTAWESAHRFRGEKARLEVPGVRRTMEALVRGLLETGKPVPLAELPGRAPGVDPAVLGAALAAALRYGLLFAGMRDADLEPMVGPWPEVAARLGLAVPEPPSAVQPVDAFEAAWLMEDMTTVMVTAAAAPIRLRANDLEIFARAREAMEARLVAVPPWVGETTTLEEMDRLGGAVMVLQRLKFVAVAGSGELRLEATPAGAKWLALSDRDRLKALLDPLRRSPDRNPQDSYSTAGFNFFPVGIAGSVREKSLDLRAALTRAFLSLPDGYVGARAFLDHGARAANPLLEMAMAGKVPIHAYWSGRGPLKRDWERLWRELLAAFLLSRLAALGGARLGITAAGELCFALTGAGRYLLGAADDFEYGQAGEGQVIVQPNLEIVFLAPAPRVEAQLARLAERAGAGPGVMFRLTRASVLAAAEAGMSADQILGALRSASSRDLPGNVERQLKDWLASVRRVTVRPALLLESPDPETAARVRGAAGKQVRMLTDTVLELPAASTRDRNALVKKLRAAGIFVGEAVG